MIDVEIPVFATVEKELQLRHPGIFFTGEKLHAPPSLPAASLIEMSNTTYKRSLDESASEHHAIIMYEVESYSNRQTGKKSEAKAIMNVIDEVMLSLNFTRSLLHPVSNEQPGIARYIARYTAVVSEAFELYRS